MITINLHKLATLKIKGGLAIFGLVILSRKNIEDSEYYIDLYQVLKAANEKRTHYGKLEVYYD